MVLDKLSEALKSGIKKFISSIFVDDKTINAFVKDIQRALLQGDVAVDIVFKLSENIKKRAKEEIEKGKVSKEHIIKIVYEELVKILGEGQKIKITETPYKILLIGLFGNGKTTTAAKLARFFKTRNYKVLLVAADTYRPAAYDQLVQLGKQIGVEVVGDPNEKDSSEIIRKFKEKFNKYDVVIVDSSGRNALEEDMIKEIKAIEKELQPQEILLVQGADIGQGAKEQAEAFKEALNITGVILTKMEGTAKGGGAITACSVAGAPIKFIGVGEKVKDLEEFDPKRFISRLLGLGDLETLLEKAEEAIGDKKKAEDMQKKLMSGKFDFNDFKEQINAMMNMGPLSKVISMIPGLGMANIPKEVLNMQQEKMKKYLYMIDSMTPEERKNPDIINRSRIERIAKGSGTSVNEVNELIKQFRQMRKLMKKMKGKDMEKLAKRLGGKKLPFGF